MNYYDILGVSSDATPKEMEKAYRRKAIELHPDLNGDGVKFKELCEAFEVLKDKNAREIYDHKIYDHNSSSVSFLDKFKNYSEYKKSKDALDVYTEYYIDLKTYINGGNIEVFYNYINFSNIVDELGKCICDRGYIYLKNLGGTLKGKCDLCNGLGFIQLKDNHNYLKENITVNIPSSFEDGRIICVEHKGNIYKKQKGNLYIKLRVFDSNESFELVNGDIYTSIDIYYTQIILGEKVSLTLPNDDVCEIDLKDFSFKNNIKKLFYPKFLGNIYCKIELKIPYNISEEYIEIIKKLRLLEQ